MWRRLCSQPALWRERRRQVVEGGPYRAQRTACSRVIASQRLLAFWPMILAALLVLLGIIVITSNPILGFIPGILMIVIGIVVGVLAAAGRGIGALASIGSTKTCPDCRMRIPSDAVVCRFCGWRIDGSK